MGEEAVGKSDEKGLVESPYTLLFNNTHIHFVPVSLSCKLVFSLGLQSRGEIIIMLLQLKPCCFGIHL